MNKNVAYSKKKNAKKEVTNCVAFAMLLATILFGLPIFSLFI